MNDLKLLIKFVKRVEETGITYKWWIKKHFPKMEYSYIYGQIKGHKPLQDYLRDAIRQYLNEK